MAASDKNIIISPQRGSTTAQPSIVFTGDGNDPITLRVLDSAIGTLSFEGSAGQLFGISDSLTSGSIFSANYASGIPAIDVNANGLVSLVPTVGKVGIGTTNPSYKLHVVGDINFTGSLYQNGTIFTSGSGSELWTAGTGDNIYRLLGNVGIGTTNPTSKLHVSGGDLHVNSLDDSDVDIKLGVHASNANFSVIRSIRASDAQSILSFNVSSNGLKEVLQFHYDEGLYVKGMGDGLSAGNAGLISFSDQSGDRLAQIVSYKTGVNNETDLIFATKGPGQGLPERLRITAAGNVGIGTDNPQAKLDVSGDLKTTGKITVDFGTVLGGAYTGLEIKGDVANSTNLSFGVAQNISRTGRAGSFSGAYIDAEGSRPISFGTNNTERLSIEGNGNIIVHNSVGIGTTNPGTKLEVYGTSRFGGTTSVGRRADIATDGILTLAYGNNTNSSNLVLQNTSDTGATTNHGSSILWQFGTSASTTAINAGRVSILKDQQWTATTTTQDSYFSIELATDGVLTERFRVASDGSVQTTTTGGNAFALSSDGSIEIVRAGSGAYIDLKNLAGEDYDARIFESSGRVAFSGVLLTDSTTIFADNATTTKTARLELSSIVLGTGATFTVTTNASGQISAISAIPAAAGANYAVGDVLSIDTPGTPSVKVSVTVATITVTGGIATFTAPTLPIGTGYTISQTNVVATSTVTTHGNRVYTLPTITSTLIGTGDTGTVTNTMLAGGITYAKIQNVSATDRLLGRSTAGAGVIEEITCTAAGRALLDDADAAAQRTTLGLGTLATQSGTFSGTSSGTNTGDQTITLTGDVTGSGTGSFATTLANSGVTIGTYRSVTVDVKGRVTAGTNPTTLSGYGITDALSNSTTSTQSGYFGDIFLFDDSTPSHYLAITNSANLTAARTLSVNVNDADRTISLSGNLTVSSATTISGTNTGDQTITLTGDVTGSGTGSFAATLANSGVTIGTYRSVTVDAKGRVTGGTNPTTLSGYGITDALSNSTTSTQSGYFGDIFLYDDSTPSHYLGITNSANLTAARTLSINVNDADRTISLSGNLTVSSAATVSGTNTGDQTITLTGDVTGSGTGSFAATIAGDAVTFAKMQNSAAAGLSVIGRSTNSAGDFAEIAAGTDGHVLHRASSTSLTFGQLPTAGIANDAVTYAKIQNVSATDRILGRSTAGAGDIEEITCTAVARTLLAATDAAGQRTALGLGTAATQTLSNLSRLVVTTAGGGNGAADGANTWCKIATFATGTTQFADCTLLLGVTNTASTFHDSAIISVFFRSNATNAAPTVDVEILSKGGTTSGHIVNDSFKVISGAWSTNMELWMKKAQQFGQFAIHELSARSQSGTLTYHDAAAWQAATPTGATNNISSDGTVHGLKIQAVSATSAAGWVVTGNSIGIANASGLYQDASNNMQFAARDGSGTLRMVLDSNNTSGSYINTTAGFSIGKNTTTPGYTDLGTNLRVGITTRAATYSNAAGGTTITVTATNHGMTSGDSVYIDFTAGTAADGYFNTVTVTNSSTFTVTSGVIAAANTNQACTLYTESQLRFPGSFGDGSNSYDHSIISERLWGGSDKSELLIFKGNDSGTTIQDNIRLAAAGDIHFHTGWAGAGSTYTNYIASHGNTINSSTVSILSSGNVGIGTTNPTRKLHVEGTSTFSSNLRVGTIIEQVPYNSLNGGTLSWEGSAGQLFSITNNLTTGSIFSVNDVSGIPSIDVDANGTIELAPFGGNVGVGTTNPASKLHVSGGDLHVNSLDDTDVDIKLGVHESEANFSVIRSIRASYIQSILSFNVSNDGLKEVAKFHYEEGLYLKGVGDGTTAGNAGLITFSDQSEALLAQIISYKPGANNAADLIFVTKASGPNFGERLRITAVGNVGIGTDNPTTNLHVLDSITNGGYDFVLGNSDQSTRGNSGSSRALVKDTSATLAINFNGDFGGGTRIDGSLLMAPQNIARNVTNSNLTLNGGTNATVGANIELYGSTHASQPSNAFYDANGHAIRSVDGATTFATINSSGLSPNALLIPYTEGAGTALTATAETTNRVLFPAAGDTITLGVGVYEVNMTLLVTRGATSTTSSALRVNLLGTGGANGTFTGTAISTLADAGTANIFHFNAVAINTNNTVTIASTTVSGTYRVQIGGIIKITTGGTFIPTYGLTVNLAGATSTTTCSATNYMRLLKISTSGTTTAQGGWG